MVFADRRDAGRLLAPMLGHLRGPHLLVLGLPRGGVPVAYEVAEALEAPLDVILVRKLGVPSQPELAMGAIGESGGELLNEEVLRLAGVSPAQLAAVVARERAELERRSAAVRHGRPPGSLAGRAAVVVDDGVATGSTARVACALARERGASPVVLAVPAAPRALLLELFRAADEVVCLEAPEHFESVGQFYQDFSQVSEEEVGALLRAAARDG